MTKRRKILRKQGKLKNGEKKEEEKGGGQREQG